ncbi:DUF6941 family protein [Dechloromonas hankyongensis]|uniref:DUF6941 family protein n=1 Tax=Dechloromonas hankyongensis TaxID=2908002 RepID=UPI003B84553B
MHRTTLVLCCNRILHDAPTNSVSAIEIYEEFSAPGLPFVIPSFSILWVVERDAADTPTVDGRVRILQGEGNILGDFPADIDFQGALRTRNMVQIGGLMISLPAPLTVQLLMGGNVVSTMTFPVTVKANLVPQPN